MRKLVFLLVGLWFLTIIPLLFGNNASLAWQPIPSAGISSPAPLKAPNGCTPTPTPTPCGGGGSCSCSDFDVGGVSPNKSSLDVGEDVQFTIEIDKYNNADCSPKYVTLDIYWTSNLTYKSYSAAFSCSSQGDHLHCGRNDYDWGGSYIYVTLTGNTAGTATVDVRNFMVNNSYIDSTDGTACPYNTGSGSTVINQPTPTFTPTPTSTPTPMPASIGDYVWIDLDADGVQDSGESGIENVTVHLLDAGGNVIATDTTDVNGKYGFNNIAPGDYAVEFILPTDYNFSPQDQGGDDASDSDADPGTGKTIYTTLTSGENDLTWDAGMYKKASLGDYVWEDANANGVQDASEPPISGVTVNLYKDVDGDGVSEPGGDDGAAIATDTTDSNGIYSFGNLDPGNYFVEFVKPNGFDKSSPSTPSNASDTDDSDADSNGVTAVTNLISGESDPTWDAGFYKLASLGDFVWWDQDEDGVQDAGEPGIKSVTVTLKDANGDVVSTTITDANGAYKFDNLEPGDYTVVFDPPSNDWTISPKDQGGDDAKDSDADPTTGETDKVTITSGADDPTIDAGMSIPSSYTINKKNTTVEKESLAPTDPISFTITITNTGKTWLAKLPLKDEYDTDYLTYVDATPASDDNNDDGVIDWSDLTASFGNDLAPGDSFSIVVHFTAKATTETLPNHETINTATAHDVLVDPDGPSGQNDTTVSLPDQSDDAPVNILDPVGIEMGDFVVTAVHGVTLLSWRSASEISILGFNILCKAKDGFERLNNSLIFARNAGADMSGFYQFATHNTGGDNAYVLEIIHLDGSVEQQELAMTPSVLTIK